MPLKLDSVQIFFKNHKPLIKEINLTVNKGEIYTIMGASGCGKSTLLSFLAGVLDKNFFYSSGSIFYEKQQLNHLEPRLRKAGLLFQEDLLFPHFSVGENLYFAMPNNSSSSKKKEKVKETLFYIGLENFYDRNPNSISGGQKARVSAMRTLLSNPNYLLLDEPFSKLDVHLREEFRSFLFNEITNQQTPTLLVTHDKSDIAFNSLVLDISLM